MSGATVRWDGMLGALVALSLAVAAAAPATAGSATDNVETRNDGERLAVSGEAAPSIAGLTPRAQTEALYENDTLEARVLVEAGGTDLELNASMVVQPEETVRSVVDETGSSTACVTIYLAQTPPIIVNPGCIQDGQDGVEFQ